MNSDDDCFLFTVEPLYLLHLDTAQLLKEFIVGFRLSPENMKFLCGSFTSNSRSKSMKKLIVKGHNNQFELSNMISLKILFL